MKKFALLVAIFLFLKPVLPLIEYVVNYDYIVKELCVNKDKPVMHCNGKCHLMKELAKNATQDAPSSEKKVANTQYEIFAILKEPFTFSFNLSKQYNVSPATVYKNLYSHTYNAVFFRPPSIV